MAIVDWQGSSRTQAVCLLCTSLDIAFYIEKLFNMLVKQNVNPFIYIKFENHSKFSQCQFKASSYFHLHSCTEDTNG